MEAYREHPGKGASALTFRNAFPLLPRKPSGRRDAISNSGNHHKVNYIEFGSTDIERAKRFYSTVFGWSFQVWGPDYISFTVESAGIDGGFKKADEADAPGKSASLIVLYSADLKAAEETILAAGGSIVVPTFEFPGGQRFHFSDGVGNVLAVWSE
ncbi:MAG: VOC family protein [Terracidiphilus sp.]